MCWDSPKAAASPTRICIHRDQVLQLFGAFPLAGMLEQGVSVQSQSTGGCLTYESNVRFALRFMIDKDVVSGLPLKTHTHEAVAEKRHWWLPHLL